MRLMYRNEKNRIEVWLGDFRELKIPREHVTISDPPYNVGTPKLIQENRNGRKKGPLGQDFGKDFDVGAVLPKDWIPHMPDTVACFYGAKGMERLIGSFRREGYEIVQDFHWCKTNAPMPMRGVGFAWGTESGYLFRRKGTKHMVNKKAGYSTNFLLAPICNGKQRGIHSTQKPLKVMKWLIRFLTIKSTIVADPFMGAGTTGVAAALMGRGFLGIEQREDYCTIAVQRIKKAVFTYNNSFQLE